MPDICCLLVYKGNNMEIKSTNSLPDINKTISTVIELLGVNVKEPMSLMHVL
jgi:hypothetical protein